MKPAHSSEQQMPVSMLVIRGSTEPTYNSNTSFERFSTFSDAVCGEPLTSQRLMLDFTPVEDVDNEFVQRKCCAFWEFINSRKDIQKLMVVPETHDLPSRKETSPKVDKKMEIKTDDDIGESTAIRMLEFAEGKGLIDRTFETKLPKSLCSLGSRQYHENMLSLEKTKEEKKKPACRCKGMCKSCKNWQPGSIIPDSTPEVKQLERQMRQWDQIHIRSMDPPGHPPALSHCILQRNIPN